MRTTLDLPEELITSAQEILGTDSKTETIINALKKVIQWNERKQLISYRGKIDLNIDLDSLRDRDEITG